MSENTEKDEKLMEQVEADIQEDISAVVADAPVPAPVPVPDARRGGRRMGPRTPRPPREKEPSEFEEKVLTIDRVTRVVKGGRRLRFRALVVIGDKKGRVAYGLGKGNEVAAATAKATYQAKRKLKNVPIIKGTLPHDTWGKSRGTQVLLKSAKKGRGLIAGGSVRTVLELAGYVDVVAKTFGSNNKINTVRAALAALDGLLPARRTGAEQVSTPVAPVEE